jgi:hypothetical protein
MYYDDIKVKPICGDYLTSIAVKKMSINAAEFRPSDI